MALIPHRFLIRLAHPCRYVKRMPRPGADYLLDLPEECRIDNYAAMDGKKNFAEVLLAWNDNGIGVQVKVRGKENVPQGDASRVHGSDGLTLWLDLRDARTSHRASRYCHQFHFLPMGGGPDRDEPAFAQSKVNRALEDAPFAPPRSVLLKRKTRPREYVLEAFLPAIALNGFDPEQHSRLGFFYMIKDADLGEQTLSMGPDFPFWEDPTLWSVLELQK